MNRGLSRINLGDVLLSHTLERAVPSGLRGLTAVFGMGTGVTPSLGSPKSGSNMDGQLSHEQLIRALACVQNEFYGQAERAISTGQLNVLLRLHIQPINVVVFHGPS